SANGFGCAAASRGGFHLGSGVYCRFWPASARAKDKDIVMAEASKALLIDSSGTGWRALPPPLGFRSCNRSEAIHVHCQWSDLILAKSAVTSYRLFARRGSGQCSELCRQTQTAACCRGLHIFQRRLQNFLCTNGMGSLTLGLREAARFQMRIQTQP